MDLLDFRRGMRLDTTKTPILEPDELYLYEPVYVDKSAAEPDPQETLLVESPASDQFQVNDFPSNVLHQGCDVAPESCSGEDCAPECGDETSSDHGELVQEEPSAYEKKRVMKRGMKSCVSKLLKCLVTLSCGLSQCLPPVVEAVQTSPALADLYMVDQVVNPCGREMSAVERTAWLSGRDQSVNWKVGTHVATGVPDCAYKTTALPCGSKQEMVEAWKAEEPEITILEPTNVEDIYQVSVPECKTILDFEAGCLEVASLAESRGKHVLWVEPEKWFRRRVTQESYCNNKGHLCVDEVFHISTTLKVAQGSAHAVDEDKPRQHFHRISKLAIEKFPRQRTFYIAENTTDSQEKDVFLHLANVLRVEDSLVDAFPVAQDNEQAAARAAKKKHAEPPVPPEVLMNAICKLHVSLGHPSQADLCRILRHGGASLEALRVAQSLSCDICDSQVRPKVPRMHKTTDLPRPLSRLAMDVKYLRSWLGPTAPRIPILNMIDLGSRYQAAEPLEGKETAAVLRKAYRNGWRKQFGAPAEVLADPASTNLGPAMMEQTTWDGSQMDPTAGQASWQNGICERAGAVLESRFNAILDTVQPRSYDEWAECLAQAVGLKNRMVKEHGYSAQQLLFGRDLPLPGCLLEGGQGRDAVANSMRLNGENQFSRSHLIRETARHCWLEWADSKAARQTLHARPRPTREFCCGDRCAYWRKPQVEHNRPRWYGRATVIGHEGDGPCRNLLLSHGRSVIRAAPEHVRLLTQSELLGEDSMDQVREDIREAMGRTGAQARTRQRGYVDLIGQPTPPEMPTAGENEVEMSGSPPDASGVSGDESTAVVPDVSGPMIFAMESTPGQNESEGASGPENPERLKEMDGDGSVRGILTRLNESRWASAEELATVRALYQPNTIDAVKFSKEPVKHVTPRPFLNNPDHGRHRWVIGLLPSGGIVETQSEIWPSAEERWHAPLDRPYQAVATVFARNPRDGPMVETISSGSDDVPDAMAAETQETEQPMEISPGTPIGGERPELRGSARRKLDETVSSDGAELESKEKQVKASKPETSTATIGHSGRERPEWRMFPRNAQTTSIFNALQFYPPEDWGDSYTVSRSPTVRKKAMAEKLKGRSFENHLVSETAKMPSERESSRLSEISVEAETFFSKHTGFSQKSRKEVNVRRLDAAEQERFYLAREKEFLKILESGAIRILSEDESREVRKKDPDRVLQPREKKARWNRAPGGV